MNRSTRAIAIWVLLFLAAPWSAFADSSSACLGRLTSKDSLLVATPTGRMILARNESLPQIPASTLKVLTGLAAMERLGPSYRFPTEFFMDAEGNLKMKGFGDPFLVSEVWEEIAGSLAGRLHAYRDLILDDTYFAPNIVIPGREHSTNPYDASVGALCANFNTVFFDRDRRGRIVSAEPQTPMIPFSRERIQALGLKKGRCAFTRNPREAARYAGELLAYFLEKKGVRRLGGIRMGATDPRDIPFWVYRSRFTLETDVRKMMEFSNNFVANQLLLAMGAHLFGEPATLEKGVRAITGFAGRELGLTGIQVVEGSGISRENRISALAMLAVLKRFLPYRELLNAKGDLRYKTGTLRNVSARVGYFPSTREPPYCFVLFFRRGGPDIDTVMDCLAAALRTENRPQPVDGGAVSRGATSF